MDARRLRFIRVAEKPGAELGLVRRGRAGAQPAIGQHMAVEPAVGEQRVLRRRGRHRAFGLEAEDADKARGIDGGERSRQAGRPRGRGCGAKGAGGGLGGPFRRGRKGGSEPQRRTDRGQDGRRRAQGHGAERAHGRDSLGGRSDSTQPRLN